MVSPYQIPTLNRYPRLPIAGPDQAGHSVQMYTDDAFLIDVLMRFIGGAIAAGDSAVVVATKAHRLELEKRLCANGMDIATAAGRVDT